MDPQPLLATDARSLDALRRQAGADPKAAVRAAAGQFESVFMRQMLKAMRDAVPKSGMWDGPAQSTYTDMLDQQMTQTLSGRPGGLAEVVARHRQECLGLQQRHRLRHGVGDRHEVHAQLLVRPHLDEEERVLDAHLVGEVLEDQSVAWRAVGTPSCFVEDEELEGGDEGALGGAAHRRGGGRGGKDRGR